MSISWFAYSLFIAHFVDGKVQNVKELLSTTYGVISILFSTRCVDAVKGVMKIGKIVPKLFPALQKVKEKFK